MSVERDPITLRPIYREHQPAKDGAELVNNFNDGTGRVRLTKEQTRLLVIEVDLMLAAARREARGES